MSYFNKAKTLFLSVACMGSLATGQVVFAEPTHVHATALSELVEYRQHLAPATVLSINESQISAEISARVVDIPVRVGDRVAAGAELVRLDDQDLIRAVEADEAKLDSLSVRLEFARYQLSRAKTLSKKQVMSEELLHQRQADVDSLVADRRTQEAALALSRQRLAKSHVRAPYEAVVTERMAQLGQLTSPGAPLIRVFDPEHLEVSADIQSNEVASLRHAADPRLLVDGREFTLNVRTIVPKVDLPSRTQQARLLFKSIPALSGRAGELKWRDDRAMIPAEFVLQRGDRYGFFVVQEGRARLIQLPDARPGRPAFLPLLSGDTMVVTDGRYGLHDGDEVVLKQGTSD